MTLESSLARGQQHACLPVTGPAPCLSERWRQPRRFSNERSAALLAVHLYDELDRSVRHGPWRNDGSTGL